MTMETAMKYQQLPIAELRRRNERLGFLGALVAIAINVVCTGFVCCCTFQLWWLPRGTRIKPMGLATLSVSSVAINAALGLTFGCCCWQLGRRKRLLKALGLLTIALGFALPIVLPVLVSNTITSLHGLVDEG